MTTENIDVRRWSVTSSQPSEIVVAAIDAAIGHPNMKEFSAEIVAAKTAAGLEAVVQRAPGKSGFMEFARFDLGAVLKKGLSGQASNSLHMVIGNPADHERTGKGDSRCGFYSPVTFLIDNRPDGVYPSYDSMASLLDAYGNDDALKVARDPDSKLERLIAQVAS